MSAHGELEVLYCDNHVLAVAKRAGVPTVPDESGRASLFDLAREWVAREFQKPGRAFLGIVHRLDQPVSGVVVFARTSKSAARLSEAFRTHRVRKVYWAVAAGVPRGPIGAPSASNGELVQWLRKDPAQNRALVVDRGAPGAKEAVTRWRVLARRDGTTLYEFEPRTGRAHQLRVCAATLGTPLLGDLRYGAREPLSDQSVALHAKRLELDHPTRAERLVLECPLPELAVWDVAR